MKRNLILICIVTLTVLLFGCKPEIEKPGKPGAITVTLLDDATAQLAVPALDNATQYVWYRNDVELTITETPNCTVTAEGRYKVAGENKAGRGSFSDEVEVKFKEPEVPEGDNLLEGKTIYDTAFRNWIDRNLANGTGIYTDVQAAAYAGEMVIEPETMQRIQSLSGIEYFTSLKKLHCPQSAELASVGYLEGLTALEELKVTGSKCTAFNLTSLTGLQTLYIEDNAACRQDGLSVTGLINLKTLVCKNNRLGSLDLSGCGNLQTLDASSNNLVKMDLSANIRIQSLNLSGNANLAVLSLDGLTACTDMNLNQTALEKIDLTPCTGVKTFSCKGNKLDGNEKVQIKVWKELNLEKLNAQDQAYFTEIGKTLVSDGVFVHEFDGEGGDDPVNPESQPAQIGDFYYSDGTWSSKMDYDKTPIGIVFQTDLSRMGEAEKAALTAKGITEPHGLVLSLKEYKEGMLPWTSGIRDEVNYDPPRYVAVPIEDITDYTTAATCNADLSGLANTQVIWELIKDDDLDKVNTYPVFSAAKRFNASTPAPEKSTGWFVPSFAQLYDVFANLANQKEKLAGKLNDEDIIYSDETPISEILNEHLKKVLPDYYTAFGEAFSLWTSSEYSTEMAWTWGVSKKIVVASWNDKINGATGRTAPRFVLAF